MTKTVHVKSYNRSPPTKKRVGKYASFKTSEKILKMTPSQRRKYGYIN